MSFRLFLACCISSFLSFIEPIQNFIFLISHYFDAEKAVIECMRKELIILFFFSRIYNYFECEKAAIECMHKELMILLIFGSL